MGVCPGSTGTAVLTNQAPDFVPLPPFFFLKRVEDRKKIVLAPSSCPSSAITKCDNWVSYVASCVSFK